MRPLMRIAAIAAAATLGFAVIGSTMHCSPASTATNSTDQARAVARGVVETAESAWLAMANACVDYAENADGGPNEATLQTCAQPLTTARDGLILAGSLVDTWGAADQKQFACVIQDVLVDMADAQTTLKDAKVSLPQVVADVFELSSLLNGPTCVTTDGGVDGGKG